MTGDDYIVMAGAGPPSTALSRFYKDVDGASPRGRCRWVDLPAATDGRHYSQDNSGTWAGYDRGQAAADLSSASRVGLVPVAMACTSAGLGGPMAGSIPAMTFSGRPPLARITAARRGYMVANRSASATRASASSLPGGGGAGGDGGGSAAAAGGASPSASAISPMAQCSVQAAWSVAVLFASRLRRSACRR